MAAATGDKTVSRVALCSAIFAGFAYVGYSVVRNAICRRGRRIDEDDDVSNGGLMRQLTVQERIRELNLQARHFGGEEGIIMRFSPFYKPRSLQCSPWSSPRILSPVDINQFISRSAENLSNVSPPQSPILRRKSTCRRRSPNRPHSGGHGNNEGATTNQVTEVHILLKDSEETLRKRLDGLYNKGRIITPYEAQSLVALLYTKDEALLLRTLTTITNCAAFSVNQNYLRDTGCLSMLSNLLTSPSSSQQVRTSAIQAIGNLSLNQDNLRELKCCLSPLMANLDRANSFGEDLLLPSLITLTNLAVLPDWHAKYVKILHLLSTLLDRGPDAVKLQVCKLLVNLSCNPSMVPHLLAAKAPASLLDMLVPSCEEEFLLRITTVLDNVTSTVQKNNLEPSDLPAEEKAPSPETLYAAIYGLNVTDKLRNRIFVLTKHPNEEIKSHAKRIYECLKGLWASQSDTIRVEITAAPDSEPGPDINSEQATCNGGMQPDSEQQI